MERSGQPTPRRTRPRVPAEFVPNISRSQDSRNGKSWAFSTLLAEAINQVRRGELDPRVANSVGHLASILLGALQQGPLEERLARLEAALLAAGPTQQ